MSFLSPLRPRLGHPEGAGPHCAQPGYWVCQTLSAASSSGPCVRALFTFGLPNASLEGAGAAALFSLEQ